MPACVVKWCKNRTDRGFADREKRITFHRFPFRNDYINEEWIRVIKDCRKDSNWQPTKYSVVCSIHFDVKYLKTTRKGYVRLFNNAVPRKLLFDPNNPTPHLTRQVIKKSARNVNSNFQETTTKTGDTTTIVLSATSVPQRQLEHRVVHVWTTPVKKEEAKKEESKNNLNPKQQNSEPLPGTIRVKEEVVIDLEPIPEQYNSRLVPEPIQVKEEETAELEKSPRQRQSTTLQGTTPFKDKDNNTNLNQSTDQQRPESVEVSLAPEYVEGVNYAKSSSPDAPRILRLKYIIMRKNQVIQNQKKAIKTLNQKVRRLEKRNQSLKNIFKALKHSLLD